MIKHTGYQKFNSYYKTSKNENTKEIKREQV